jgi:hypothetical protein
MFSAIRRYAILAAPMRFKLVLLTSFIGALSGAGASVGIVFATLGSWRYFISEPTHDWTGVVLYAIPLATALVGSIFVYRHTARRRKLQSVLTGLLILLLCLLVFIGLTFSNL